jgi:hypothetical protein
LYISLNKFKNLNKFKLNRYVKVVRTVDYLIVNLMVTDLLMVVPNFPLAAYNSFYGKWMFEQHG